MDLESFDINQQIKVKRKSINGINRIMEHGDIWRIKNKVKKGYFPWVKTDSLLLESLKDRVTSNWLCLSEDEHFKLI